VQRSYEAPVGEVEQALAAIWSKVLGVKQVGRWDNFFELGGHSLLAIRVTTQIRRRLRVELSLSELFSNPELQACAAILKLPQRPSAENAVPIRSTGTQHPLFLTHEGADEIVYAYTVADYVDPDIPVYALPAQQTGEYRLWTTEGIAQRMVQMIRAVQPFGPYRIGSYGAFGAALAHEIATQLLGAAEQIELLALLDPQLLNGEHFLINSATASRDLRVEFLTIINAFVRISGMPESVQNAVRELQPSSQTFEELFYYCKEKGWLPDSMPYESPVHYQKICQHKIEQRLNPYFLSPLPIDVHLFIAKDDPHAPKAIDDFIAQVPGSRLKGMLIPGAHFTMLQEPNVRHLGLAFSQVIQEITGKSANTSLDKPQPCLQALQSSVASSLPPIFCIPALAAGADSFSEFASVFNDSQIYAFQPRGLEKDSIPHSTIEAAAATYLEELLIRHPSGPVHLVGHLRGGWIAFQIAIMLQAAGRDELSLTLLNSEPPNGDNPRPFREYTANDVVAQCLEIIKLSTGKPCPSLEDLGREAPAVQADILVRLLLDCRLLRAGSSVDDLYPLLKTLGMGLRINYRPETIFLGTIRLVTTRDCSQAGLANSTDAAGWKRWASDVIECQTSGNRITMLSPPHVLTLAELLQREMNAKVFKAAR
jgi:thioesterase domain-containing protein